MVNPIEFENPDIRRSSMQLDHEVNITQEMKEFVSKSTIVHIAPLWLPLPRDGRTYGGAEDVVNNNVTVLENAGVKQQIIFGHPGNAVLADRIGAKVYSPRHLAEIESEVGNLLTILRTDLPTAREIERYYVHEAYTWLARNYDQVTVVHDHTNMGREYGAWYSKNFRPVVRTEHGPLIYPYAPKSEEEALRKFENRHDVGFIAISHDQMSGIPNLNWLGVNYNGVGDDFEYRENKDDYLLFLGRVCEAKGVHNAIEVARMLGKQLKIAGSVEETPDSLLYFEKYVAPFVDGKQIIHYKDGVDSEKRKELLSHARATLVLNTWREPFGMIMAESMASGTPVVGFARGSIPEIVRNNTGFVVNTLEEAAQAVKRIENGEFYPQACLNRAQKLFSAEAMTARNIQIYMKAVELADKSSHASAQLID